MEEILKIIDVHVKTNRYINCLENIFVMFEQYNINYNDRNKIINIIDEHNLKIYSEERKKEFEISRIDGIKPVIQTKKEEKTEDMPSISSVPEPLLIDISSYLTRIKKTGTLEQILEILPERNEHNFDNILTILIIKLYKDKVDILNFISKQEDKKEVFAIFEEELELIDSKIDFIIDYKDNASQLIIPKTDKENKIVFLKNSFNEPVIFHNIKGYEEYYESFLELLNSISDGTFKNIRMFTNNDRLVNIFEVKNFKTRILFTRLKDNIYIVLSAFVKKCDTDLRHRNFLVNSTQNFYNKKGEILKNIEDEEYLMQEEEYLIALKEILSEKGKVKKREFNRKIGE